MGNTDCFLCQKPNCVLKCPKPNCGIFYCSDSHYSSHIYRTKETKTIVSSGWTNGENKSCSENLLVDSNKTNEDFICLPYRIQTSKGVGRHFVATRDIKPLELIVSDAPGVVGPATKTRPVCIVCLNPARREFRYKVELSCQYLFISFQFKR